MKPDLVDKAVSDLKNLGYGWISEEDLRTIVSFIATPLLFRIELLKDPDFAKTLPVDDPPHRKGL